MALRDLTQREILQAVAEYNRIGRDRFLEKYGFGPARSYLLVVGGKTYDSKAIVGAAHGHLADREPLAPSDFSGGAATVGRLLTSLGFEVSQAGPGLIVEELVNSLSALRLYRSPDGRVALYQPLTLLWAIGRAHQDLPRLAGWDETKTLLGDFLEHHGEQPRPHYPVTALYHAGLWELGGSWSTPPAHDSTQMGWFNTNQPASGLGASFYDLVRYSGEARLAAVEALVNRYLRDADCDAILEDAGLADADVADDEAPAGEVVIAASPIEEQYRRLCEIAARLNGNGTRFGRARQAVDVLRLGSARSAVLARSGGHCENPHCTGEAKDLTDAGRAILEVDHVQDLAKGGLDEPGQMIALCPNCHAIKTRGRSREKLRRELLVVAGQRHNFLWSQGTTPRTHNPPPADQGDDNRSEFPH
ncbi:MAG TPA: HNH endonuclease signature motif containing protein [Streptosporangiaceae bacterium]|nr:HNH endonuclease signature motif containing protein [Streptosporangiaceae bacterium]